MNPRTYTLTYLDSGAFAVSVSPVILPIESYEWLWEAPDGSENDPHVHFETPDEASSVVKNTRWFAYPYLDKTGPLRLAKTTGTECIYEINCNVRIGESIVSDLTPPKWRVYVPSLWGETSEPRIIGFPDISARELESGKIEWYVSGKGSLARKQPEIQYFLVRSSQFFPKAKAHEERHVEQFTSIAPYKDYFDADALFDQPISTMTGSRRAELVNRIKRTIEIENEADHLKMIAREADIERDAWRVSNAVPPDYLERDIP
jgi:hypothetical protein